MSRSDITLPQKRRFGKTSRTDRWWLVPLLVFLVVADDFAFLGLVLIPKVAAAGLITIKGIVTHQVGEFDEVGYPSGSLQGLVDALVASGDEQIAPELFADLGDALDGLLEPIGIAGHAAVFPDHFAELPMQGQRRLRPADPHEAIDSSLRLLLRSLELGKIVGDLVLVDVVEVVADGLRQHEVAVGEALHH